MKKPKLTVEMLTGDARKELEFLVASTSKAHVLKNPKGPGYKHSIARMAESVAHAHRRTPGGLKGDTTAEKVRNSVHGRWAQALNTATSQQHLSRLVSTRIGRRSIKDLFTMGNFKWTAKNPGITAQPPGEHAKPAKKSKPAKATTPKTKTTPKTTHIPKKPKLPTPLHREFNQYRAETDKKIASLATQIAGLTQKITDAAPQMLPPSLARHRHTTTIMGTETITGKPVVLTKIPKAERTAKK